MTYREIFNDIIRFRRPAEPPMTEFMGMWPETIEAWEKHTGGVSVMEHFGLYGCEDIPVRINLMPPFEKVVHEETGEYQVITDEYGVRQKVIKNSSAMPQFLEFPVKTRSDFNELKKRLDPTAPGRNIENWAETVERLKKSEYPTYVGQRGPFFFMTQYVGVSELMHLFCDDGGLVREMADFHAETACAMWDRVFGDIIPDFAVFGEDMAYKGASLISPQMIREYLLPAWKKLTSYLRSHGVDRIIVDSDGYIEEILPLFVEGGFTGVLPMERAAGMDPGSVRERYPDLVIIGGVDKLKIAAGRREINEEVKKAARLYDKGGYIPSIDHSVPPIISYENYAYYNSELRKALT